MGHGYCCYGEIGQKSNDLNQHYARISTDAEYYKSPLRKLTANQNQAVPVVPEHEIFHMLDNLHHTAEGNDKLPAWYLRLTAAIKGLLW